MPNKLLEMWERHGRGNFKVVMGSKYWVFLSEPDDIGVIFFLYDGLGDILSDISINYMQMTAWNMLKH